MDNLARFLLDHNRDKIALIDSDRKMTYGEVTRAIKRFAGLLRERGIASGDRVAIVMADRCEWIIAFLAMVSFRCVPVLISPMQTDQNKKRMLEDCECSAVITDGSIEVPKDMICFTTQSIMNGSDPINIDGEIEGEIGILTTTSGTSGYGQSFLVHRYQTFFNMIDLHGTMNPTDENSVVFSSAKLSFHFGLMNASICLANGGTFVMTEHVPDRNLVKRLCRDHKITHMFTTPRILAGMIKTDKPDDSLNSIQWLLCSGEPLPLSVEAKFKELYGITVMNGLGQGEIIGWTACSTPDHHKFGTLGKAALKSIVEVRREDGTQCDVNEVGEVWIKNNTTAIGYWKGEERNKTTFIDGWVRSNDMVYVDEEGYFHFVCRKDDYVKVNAQFANPIEIEQIIEEHDSVVESVVTSRLSTNGLVELSAKIVTKNNINARDIRRFLKNRVEPHKIPKNIEFVDNIPKTVTLKKIRNRRYK